MFEPLRFVTSSQVGFTNPTINKVTMIMTQVNEDLETNGETSDFWSLSEEVKTENCETRGSRGLRLLDPGIDFALCARRPLRPPDM